MPLSPADFAALLTPPTSPSAGAQAAIQGFDSFGRAASRYRAAEQRDQDLARQERELRERQRAALAEEALRNAQLEQKMAMDRIAALESLAPKLVDPASRAMALAGLQEAGWQRQGPAPSPAAPPPTASPMAPSGGSGIGDFDPASMQAMSEPEFSGMISELAGPTELAAVAGAPPPPTDIVLQGGRGQRFSIDPEAQASQLQDRLRGTISQLRRAAPRRDQAIYQQVEDAADELVRTHGFDPKEAEEASREMMLRLLQMASNERAAQARARQQAKGGEEKLSDDAISDFRVAVRLNRADETVDAYQSIKKGLELIANNPRSPSAWNMVQYGLAKGVDTGKLSDKDVNMPSGHGQRSAIQVIKDFIARGVWGGPSEQTVKDVTAMAESSLNGLRLRALEEFGSLSEHRSNYAPAGALPNNIAYQRLDLQLRSLYGRMPWFEKANRARGGGGRLPASSGKLPKVSDVPRPDTSKLPPLPPGAAYR